MGNMNWKKSAIVILGAWSISAIAHDVVKAFDDLDTDGDGYISRSEGTGRPDVRANWNTIDVNKDGKLTIREFSAYEKIPGDTFPTE